MNLTHEEWLDIKEYLNELLIIFEESAEIYKNHRRGDYYQQECNKIKEFLSRRSSQN